jgi:hypothetical protein
VRLLILALAEMATAYLRFGVSLMEFETSELVEHINRVAKYQEVVNGDEKVTNARRIGWLLKRLRFQKATPGKTRKRWKTTAAEIISLARAYGMTVSLEENAENGKNAETQVS